MGIKKVIAGIIINAVAASIVAVDDVDPTDFTLIAYELTKEQEAAVEIGKGKLAPFWSAWNTAGGKLDYVHELPETHGRQIFTPKDAPKAHMPGFFSGKDDAQLWARAAWGDKGLYLYIEVLDDDFVDLVASSDVTPEEDDGGHKGAEYWMNDCVDFALDIYDSETQKKYYVEKQSQETFTYMQYQLRFGSPSKPASQVRINYQNPNPPYEPGWTVTEFHGVYGWLLLFDLLSFAEAKNKYNIHMEIIPLSERRMAQQWFFPWSKIASTGINKPVRGQKIALTLGYMDLDGTENKYPDGLFLKNLGNQYSARKTWRGVNWAQQFGESGENWGDIQFGPKLNDIVNITIQHNHSLTICSRQVITTFDSRGRTVGVATKNGVLAPGIYITEFLATTGFSGSRLRKTLQR